MENKLQSITDSQKKNCLFLSVGSSSKCEEQNYYLGGTDVYLSVFVSHQTDNPS
jgi:hypothetical protein